MVSPVFEGASIKPKDLSSNIGDSLADRLLRLEFEVYALAKSSGIDSVKSELKTDIKDLDTKIDARLKDLDTKIDAIKTKIDFINPNFKSLCSYNESLLYF
jgi:hypothetical protein